MHAVCGYKEQNYQMWRLFIVWDVIIDRVYCSRLAVWFAHFPIVLLVLCEKTEGGNDFSDPLQ